MNENKLHCPKCPASSMPVICTCDGYHTFDELYEHRVTLFIALCRKIVELADGDSGAVWRSKQHHSDKDGKQMGMYDGWYIMGIDAEQGKQITYHLPISTWEATNFADTIEEAPEFDGHTPADVVERLKAL